ncbi:winged helix DNA-binding domain-containing protein [Desulfonema limicola]|uniref:Winged helix DNA-binding domain-containing protein n=1 Tax=Desulfonema limicola TaxID=45656 RepID=A0A975B341_9BACT|nr:hypothetical protein [Desulfonema limicola]QTA77900.1 winged helix DNA-binding domain-containing protein [Desulfonema limicola]
MAGKKKRPVSFNTLVKMFMRDYNIPTKKDIDKLITRMDRLEQLIREISDRPRYNPQKRKTPGSSETASARVLDIIKEYKKGINFSEIKEKTGFKEKRLRNIIYNLDKTGKIKKIGRGIYTADSEQ